MDCRYAHEGDLPAIMEIYNHAVRHTTAIWNETEVDLENRRTWMTARKAAGFPVLVAVEQDQVLGYASFGDWRAFEGYRHTVEHSVYVRHDRRGHGTGRFLMEQLIVEARRMGKHVMIGGIASDNAGSIHLHQKLGFIETGRLPQVGTKFGKWLDLVFLQLQLDARETPDQELR